MVWFCYGFATVLAGFAMVLAGFGLVMVLFCYGFAMLLAGFAMTCHGFGWFWSDFGVVLLWFCNGLLWFCYWDALEQGTLESMFQASKYQPSTGH